jgi:hypothetical protein
LPDELRRKRISRTNARARFGHLKVARDELHERKKLQLFRRRQWLAEIRMTRLQLPEANQKPDFVDHVIFPFLRCVAGPDAVIDATSERNVQRSCHLPRSSGTREPAMRSVSVAGLAA